MAPADAPPGPPTEAPIAREPHSEPIPGYRLLEPLGRGGFGEVWKCEAPGGLHKAIKFVEGGLHACDTNAPAEEELRAIERVKAIRHPFILSMERVERVGNELVIVLELADKNLFDLFTTERKAGKPGIGREALLGYLREAAEALDLMNVRYDLQHLDIKPQNLFLVCNHVKVGDFGLVNSLPIGSSGSACRAPALQLGAITPIYASPEVFQGSLSRHSDQYSLAIVYQELLTGTLPFTGKNSRQLLMQHLQGEPQLGPLGESDRLVVARALTKKPSQRFPSCSDFIHALVAGQTEIVSATVPDVPPPDPSKAETRRTKSLQTIRTRAIALRPPLTADAAGGLEEFALLSRAPLTEVWQARAADGSARLVKVLFGLSGQAADGIARLTSLRHPALPRLEVLQHAPGRLVLCGPPVERTLRDDLQECLAAGQVGIPREPLLADLRCVAEALDDLADEQGLQHLGLNPRVLLLAGETVQLADFGLAALLWLPAGQNIAQLNGRYSPPELFAGQVSTTCDQYSLALIYHELLTGALPSSPAGKGQLPCLDRLPEADRPIVARALAVKPKQRWESCVELLEALASARSEAPSSAAGAAPRFIVPRHAPPRAEAREALQTRFGTALGADVIRARLDGFREQWKGKVIVDEASTLIFHMQAPQSFWQRWTGRQPGLEVQVQLSAPQSQPLPAVVARTEVRVDIRPHQCGREQSREMLKVVGPLLVESVRKHLQVNPRGRAEERLIWNHPLQVCLVGPDGSTGPPVECHGKDISLNGIGFYLPGQEPTPEVLLHLPQTSQTPQIIVPARVVRAQVCGDGWYEVGAVLLYERGPLDEDG